MHSVMYIEHATWSKRIGRIDKGWWVGEEWCPRDPKVSAVPRGKDSRVGKKKGGR